MSVVKPCKRPSRDAAPEVVTAYHRERLVRRRLLQRSGRVGFFLVPNRKIDAAIEMQTMRNVLAGQDPADARHNAMNAVARTLSMPPMARSLRVRPSKSDNASYRK